MMHILKTQKKDCVVKNIRVNRYSVKFVSQFLSVVVYLLKV